MKDILDYQLQHAEFLIAVADKINQFIDAADFSNNLLYTTVDDLTAEDMRNNERELYHDNKYETLDDDKSRATWLKQEIQFMNLVIHKLTSFLSKQVTEFDKNKSHAPAEWTNFFVGLQQLEDNFTDERQVYHKCQFQKMI